MGEVPLTGYIDVENKKTDVPVEDLIGTIGRLNCSVLVLKTALAEADEILEALFAEYDKDEQCDYVKINQLIERGHRYLAIKKSGNPFLVG